MRHYSGTSTRLFAFVLALALSLTSPAHAQTFTILHNFASTDGSGPLAGLVMDTKQNLYGTTSSGGEYNGGVVFKASRGGAEMVMHSFGSGTDGYSPEGSLIIDSAGNLYGTTFAGGSAGAGTVFKISSNGKESILYSFAGNDDGANPVASLAMDASGNLYGTTSSGGNYNSGTVFELSSTGQHSVLYSFGSIANDGTDPVAGVTLDPKGNLYGTASAGGPYGYGTVFELKYSTAGFTENILHNFEMQNDGGTPYAGLIFDRSGNLYGAATQGGSGEGGTVFELTRSGSGWTFNVLNGLAGWGISGTFRNVLFDASTGIIYATTHCDGAYSSGTVYSLTPSAGTWSYTELYTFTGGTDGYYVFSNLVMDKSGNLYGTTNTGGANGYGEIFRVTP
ncbi:MAG: choice-of-anchor tandem repeat GloVer-containing protein [Candidatus Sulfotelmatobacter sp.]